MSIRTDIRKEVHSSIQAGGTDAGLNVFNATPQRSISAYSELPCVFVTTTTSVSEVVTLGTVGTRTLQRVLDVQVHCVGRGSAAATVEEQLDTLAEQIEPLLVAAPSVATGWYLVGEEIDTLDNDDDGILAEHVLTYRAEYRTAEGNHTITT